jgi:threonine/homoserine/homoserine lactone efflux protein
MNLSAPTLIVFVISIVLAILGLLAALGALSILPIPAFWLLATFCCLLAVSSRGSSAKRFYSSTKIKWTPVSHISGSIFDFLNARPVVLVSCHEETTTLGILRKFWNDASSRARV